MPSSPLVPRNDPTLLFTNAGMVQFKNVFTGQEKRALPARDHPRRNACAPAASTTISTMSATPRATTPSSRCWAISPSATISRNDAIELAWDLITKDFGLAKDRLLVTVYADDDEAFGAVEEDRRPARTTSIIRIATSDNFWSMGDTGPCGPCSEIFYDHGDAYPGRPAGLARTRTATASSRSGISSSCSSSSSPAARAMNLPKPSIDTGMGLERITAVLQGVHDNYDIDLFRHLIAASVEAIGAQRRRRRMRSATASSPIICARRRS